MHLNNLDKKFGTAVIKFDNDEESQLIEESMNLLIEKQEEMVKRDEDDPEEVEKLEKYKKTKKVAIEIPKIKKMKEKKIKDKVDKIKQNNNNNIKLGRKEEEEEDDDDDDDEGDSTNLFISEADSKIQHRNMHDIVNAVNEHINRLELDGSFNAQNKIKYEKLNKLLEKAQENKSIFERVTPKPKGFGHLRK